MSRSAKTPLYRQILIDIDTQSHFFSHHSSVCIRNPRRILENVRKVIHWAQMYHIPTISTLQVHPNHSTYLAMPNIITRHRNAPNMASGTATNMISGSTKLSNCAERTR